MASTEGERRNKDLQPNKPMQNSCANHYYPAFYNSVERISPHKKKNGTKTAPRRGRAPPTHTHTPPPLTIAEKKRWHVTVHITKQKDSRRSSTCRRGENRWREREREREREHIPVFISNALHLPVAGEHGARFPPCVHRTRSLQQYTGLILAIAFSSFLSLPLSLSDPTSVP
jgi:hypothetical protein